MGNVWENLWEIYGKIMGNLWENYGFHISYLFIGFISDYIPIGSMVVVYSIHGSYGLVYGKVIMGK